MSYKSSVGELIELLANHIGGVNDMVNVGYFTH